MPPGSAEALEEDDRVLLAHGELRRADEEVARPNLLERGLDLGGGGAGLAVPRRDEAVRAVVLEREGAQERGILGVPGRRSGTIVKK